MEKEICRVPNIYTRPMVVSHQPVRFETAQSWNPGQGNLNHSGTGNDGTNFPPGNPNPTGVGVYKEK
jgi:hypothetical protein